MRIRIRIQQLKLMRIHADPDPKPWIFLKIFSGFPPRIVTKLSANGIKTNSGSRIRISKEHRDPDPQD
jgi:hypothetical protein